MSATNARDAAIQTYASRTDSSDCDVNDAIFYFEAGVEWSESQAQRGLVVPPEGVEAACEAHCVVMDEDEAANKVLDAELATLRGALARVEERCADLRELLQAEREERHTLETENAELQVRFNEAHDGSDAIIASLGAEYEDRIAALEAENLTLRDALARVEAVSDGGVEAAAIAYSTANGISRPSVIHRTRMRTALVAFVADALKGEPE
jgi:hypothetical protein